MRRTRSHPSPSSRLASLGRTRLQQQGPLPRYQADENSIPYSTSHVPPFRFPYLMKHPFSYLSLSHVQPTRQTFYFGIPKSAENGKLAPFHIFCGATHRQVFSLQTPLLRALGNAVSLLDAQGRILYKLSRRVVCKDWRVVDFCGGHVVRIENGGVVRLERWRGKGGENEKEYLRWQKSGEGEGELVMCGTVVARVRRGDIASVEIEKWVDGALAVFLIILLAWGGIGAMGLDEGGEGALGMMEEREQGVRRVGSWYRPRVPLLKGGVTIGRIVPLPIMMA